MSNLIVVDITEREKILLDGSLELKQIEGFGTLIIKNPTTNSRLWNLTCDLKEIINTSIKSRELNVGILNPGQEFTLEYSIQNLKAPSIKATEIFDTNYEIPDKVNNAFIFEKENPCKLILEVENPLDLTVSDIKVSRELPDFIQEIEIKVPNVGTASLVEEGKRLLSWTITSLEPGQRAVLEVYCKVTVQDSSEKALGELLVTYLINNYKLTMLEPEVRGLTDSMSGIDRDEGSQPGMWDCTVEFINESEFQVRLESVKVDQRIPTGSETVVSQNPNKVLNPDESWDFEFQVEAKDVPELSSEISFTPLFVVITRVPGEIKKESTVYQVLQASIEKIIDPPEVDAYANTDMTIENIVVNKGSSPIDKLIITDTIPQDFIPPQVDEIKIFMNEMDLSERTEFIEKITIEPDDKDPDKSHLIEIKLFNLKNDLMPRKELRVKYPLKAKNPRPPSEMKYMTPVKIDVNSPVEGSYYEKMPEVEPEIKVRYVKRKLKTLKSIKPGATEGEFSISVRVQNKGDVELENIIIKDKIPQGFTLTEINFDNYELAESEGLSEIHVKIDELKGNDAVILKYSCTGAGEYPRYEPDVVVLGREGLEQSAVSSKPEEESTVPSTVSGLSLEKKALIHDLFSEIFKKIDQAITGNQLADHIESIRDKFPPGPVLHQFMQFAKEIRTRSPDKIIIGSMRDEIVGKLEEFKQKYS